LPFDRFGPRALIDQARASPALIESAIDRELSLGHPKAGAALRAGDTDWRRALCPAGTQRIKAQAALLAPVPIPEPAARNDCVRQLAMTDTWLLLLPLPAGRRDVIGH
jgi:hypothetical protein